MRMYLQVQRYLTRAFFWSAHHLCRSYRLYREGGKTGEDWYKESVRLVSRRTAFERIRRIQDNQDQILALAF